MSDALSSRLRPAPSPAPPAVTCAAALAHGAPNHPLLYFALLPAALARLVDQFILLNAWRWTGTLTRVAIPVPEANFETQWQDRFVRANGEDVYCRCDRADDLNTEATLLARLDPPPSPPLPHITVVKEDLLCRLPPPPDAPHEDVWLAFAAKGRCTVRSPDGQVVREYTVDAHVLDLATGAEEVFIPGRPPGFWSFLSERRVAVFVDAMWFQVPRGIVYMDLDHPEKVHELVFPGYTLRSMARSLVFVCDTDDTRLLLYSLDGGYGAVTALTSPCGRIANVCAHSNAFFFVAQHGHTQNLWAVVLDAPQTPPPLPAVPKSFAFVAARLLAEVRTNTQAELLAPRGSDAHGPMIAAGNDLWVIQ